MVNCRMGGRKKKLKLNTPITEVKIASVKPQRVAAPRTSSNIRRATVAVFAGIRRKQIAMSAATAAVHNPRRRSSGPAFSMVTSFNSTEFK